MARRWNFHPCFRRLLDYDCDVDGKGLSLFASNSAYPLDEQKVAMLAAAFGNADL